MILLLVVMDKVVGIDGCGGPPAVRRRLCFGSGVTSLSLWRSHRSFCW
jgi:hypothetical protein